MPVTVEGALLEVLHASALPGETAQQAFARKEHELGGWFARLAPAEALALHRRLSNPRPDDVLASAFGRLIIERRHRLLAFLSDARRRAALARHRAA